METMIIGIAGNRVGQDHPHPAAEGALWGGRVDPLPRQLQSSTTTCPMRERCRLNYDHPDAFDTELLIADLQALRRGRLFTVPPTTTPCTTGRRRRWRCGPPGDSGGGILIFVDPALRELMDIKLFVDTDADVRILRRIMRDVKKAGALSGLGGAAVPHHRQAHARAVCGALQALRRPHCAGGRQKRGGPGYDHPAGQEPYGAGIRAERGRAAGLAARPLVCAESAGGADSGTRTQGRPRRFALIRPSSRGIEAAQGEEPAADDGTGAQPEQGQQSNQQLHPPPVRQMGSRQKATRNTASALRHSRRRRPRGSGRLP